MVIDYALRLKRELGENPIWVAGYSNDVMAYIPSERVLTEGGYEGGGAMRYSNLPNPWRPGVEDRIIATVRELTARLRGKSCGETRRSDLERHLLIRGFSENSARRPLSGAKTIVRRGQSTNGCGEKRA